MSITDALSRLSDEELHLAMSWLMRRGLTYVRLHTAAAHVRRIADLEHELSALRGPRAAAGTSTLVAARRLQGRYLGAIRHLPPADRRRVRAIANVQGVQAALALALDLDAGAATGPDHAPVRLPRRKRARPSAPRPRQAPLPAAAPVEQTTAGAAAPATVPPLGSDGDASPRPPATA